MYKYIYWFKRRTPGKYQPVILITGCSSGIGLALSELFFKMSTFRLVITARSQSLSSLKQRFPESDRFLIRALDVTNPVERESLIQEIEMLWGGVDILINNAGISYRSVVEHMTDADELKQMATNYLGPAALIRLVIPKMRSKGRGKIINISSVSGMLAMPTMSSYSASKYALEGASEALWYEMRPFGINVSLVQPGFIHSTSFEKVYFSETASRSEVAVGPYYEYYQSMGPFVRNLMNFSRTTPEKVANLVREVIYTIDPPLWIPATIDAEFFYYLRRIFPRRLLHPILFLCLPNVKTWGLRDTHKRPDFWQRLKERYLK